MRLSEEIKLEKRKKSVHFLSLLLRGSEPGIFMFVFISTFLKFWAITHENIYNSYIGSSKERLGAMVRVKTLELKKRLFENVEKRLEKLSCAFFCLILYML
jgi:hypothetical protein